MYLEVTMLWRRQFCKSDGNGSARPRFVRGNKKITSQNKYYLCYLLKKGKLMPRHHAQI